MRRNSLNKRNVNYFYKTVFLGSYQIFTSLYPILSPLLGFFFARLILLKIKKEKTKDENSKEWYFVFFYLIFIEINHGFYLFSSILFFYVFYYLLADWLSTSFKCEVCILIVFIVFGYIGIYAVNNLVSYILNNDFFPFGWEYIWYIFIDSLILSIFFRGRM